MLKKLRKLLPGKWGQSKPVIPVVRLHGAIGISSPLRPGLTLASAAGPLETAFKMKEAPAVALSINSPGGSPVQSNLIFKRIRALAEEHEKDVLVFVEDVAASGGYMIALAGDDIYVDPSSIVGSIGVVSAGFGYTGLIEKLGVERRVYTAGEKKVTLDPFAPENKGDIEHLKSLQKEIHEVFIDMVKSRRGDVLADDPDLFSGLFWTGAKAQDLGLVDGISDVRSTIKERYGKDTELKLIDGKRKLFGRLLAQSQIAPYLGSVEGLPETTISVMEEKALWARYGL
ncbi:MULTISPECIES: S49 family peptidase [Pseudovibrio]|uniref:S49 family peptidase n=1 Tax=Stappiaceae TaxID=2821832 RepID=UPI002366F636|nr:MULTISPECIES: S49 family peptidase [Pseudovibrio]MDD7911231.1 S49 family peptidase [Pseudovibrio exalbescens]MDX5593082.1 S49 family peptidase [Pseudovibrio sp. SPO723]